jgi:outer membrane biosynthesis protein TonB
MPHAETELVRAQHVVAPARGRSRLVVLGLVVATAAGGAFFVMTRGNADEPVKAATPPAQQPQTVAPQPIAQPEPQPAPPPLPQAIAQPEPPPPAQPIAQPEPAPPVVATPVPAKPPPAKHVARPRPPKPDPKKKFDPDAPLPPP